jgi:hypothetical protein
VLDHVVYAVPDLDRAAADFARRTGLEPARGGSHPGLGTANVLVGLGGAQYLELIGPDPAQSAPDGGRWFLVDRIEAARVVTWAVRTDDIDAAVTGARANGYDPGPPQEMSRATPTGEQLRWRLTPPRPEIAHGLVPFLIDWGPTPHPTTRELPRATLVSLTGTHPEPARVGAELTALGADLRVDAGDVASLILTIETPRGLVTLR